MWPSRKQWEQWSLPSKLTAVGALIGLVSIVLTISFGFFSPASNVPRTVNVAAPSVIQSAGTNGANLNINENSGKINIESSSDEKPYTDLKIVDVTSDGTTVDFKLKNSGNDSVFIKEVSFVFFHGGVGNHCCMMVGFDTYRYNFNAVLGTNSVNVRSDIEEVSDDKMPAEQGIFLVKHRRVVGGVHSSMLPAAGQTKMEDVLLSVKESPPLAISRVVPPRGIDRFQIEFQLPPRSDWPFSPFSPFDGCCAVVSYEGFAVISYDQEDELRTPEFWISFSEERGAGKGAE